MEAKYPIINASEYPLADTLYFMSAGAYGDTCGYVWADSCESAFEIFAEYLDEVAPGLLVSHDEFSELLDAQARERGFESWLSLEAAWGCDNSRICEVVEAAEADLTPIGHTTLKHGAYIASYEWGMIELPDAAEYGLVAAASVRENLQSQREEIKTALVDMHGELEANEAQTVYLALDGDLDWSAPGTREPFGQASLSKTLESDGSVIYVESLEADKLCEALIDSLCEAISA
jgi:hypothetical protein